MKQYVITYLGGDKPSSPEEGRKNFANYQKWLTSLDDAVIQAMVPFGNIHTIHSDRSVKEGSTTQMSGQTIIQAESIEKAIELTQACPFLDTNGQLELAEMIEM